MKHAIKIKEFNFWEVADNQYNKYIDYFKTLYSSRFKLKKEDSKMTNKLFRTLQELAFENGTVGIAKTTNGTLIPVIVKVLSRNGEGKPISATYYTLNMYNENGKFMTLAKYDSDIEKISKNDRGIMNVTTLDFRTTLYLSSQSGIDIYGATLEKLAILEAQITKSTLMANDKFFINKKTSNQTNFEKDIIDPSKTIITSGDGGSKNEFSGFGGDIGNAVEGETSIGVLEEKIARINIQLNLKDNLESIETIIKQLKMCMGIRINTALGNKSRTNTTESTQEETQFALAEKRQQDVLDDFIKNFNELNKTNLEIETNVVGNLTLDEKELKQTVDNLDIKNNSQKKKDGK